MRVYLGSDHAGFELKARLLEHLASLGVETVDVGAHAYDADDDYPPFCVETARLAREHNDAQVIGIGARMHTFAVVAGIVEAFLATPFSGSARHQRRIDMLAEYERTGEIPVPN